MIQHGEFLNTTVEDRRNYFTGQEQHVGQPVQSISFKDGVYRIENGSLVPVEAEQPVQWATPANHSLLPPSFRQS